MRRLRSQNGNALLMVLGLVAFVSVISVEIYRRSEVTARRSEQAQFKDETEVIMDAFASNLQNPDTCTRALFNQQIAPGAAAPVVMNYKYDRDFNGAQTTTQGGTEVTQGMVVDLLEVFAAGPEDMVTQITEIPVPLRRYRASLRAVFRSTAAKGMAAVNRRVEPLTNMDLGLPFYVWVDDSNRIKSCFGINSAGAFCNFARGYYHVVDPTGGQPPLAHALSCRQTLFTQIPAYGIAAPNDRIGTCRYRGIAPSGTCPASSFVNPPPFSEPLQIGVTVSGRTYQAMDLCQQCQ